VAGSISISRKEERQNSGEARILNLLQSKIRQAEMTMTEKLNGDLLCGTVSSSTFVPDTARDGSYGLLPLAFFLRKLKATNPSAPTTVGNISSASYSWWRHRVGDFGGNSTTNADINTSFTTYAGIKVGLARMYNYCSRGTGGSPDLIVADQVSFETYNNALDVQVRYQNTKMADMGFDTIKLRGATMLWDEKVPDVYTGTAAITTGTAFFINTDFYKLVIDSQTDIITTPFVEPENQTARTAKVLFMGNATCSNLRKMGVAIAISQSIVA
jgi:hypothetical protein